VGECDCAGGTGDGAGADKFALSESSCRDGDCGDEVL
jgi:hypothetical protein